jgi:hypothetical protein
VKDLLREQKRSNLAITLFYFDPDRTPSEVPGSNKGRAASTKRFKNRCARRCWIPTPDGTLPELLPRLVNLTLKKPSIRTPAVTDPCFVGVFRTPSQTPCAVMSLKTKYCPFSQAGRRGFDPGLPLQLFYNLATSTSSRFTGYTAAIFEDWQGVDF